VGRCDRSFPCQHCLRSTSEICNYLFQDESNESVGDSPGPEKAQPAPVAMTAPGEKRKRPTEKTYPDVPLRRASMAQESSNSLMGVPTTVPIPGLSRERLLQRDFTSSSDSAPLGHADKDLVREARRGPGTAVSTSPSHMDGENGVIRGIFSKTRFFGQSHWMNSVIQVGSLDLTHSCIGL